MYAEAEKVKDTFAKEKANKNYCQLKRNDSFNEFKFLSAIVVKMKYCTYTKKINLSMKGIKAKWQ